MSLRQFLSILRARRGVALLILLSVVGIALAWVLVRPAEYVARAPVLVEPRPDPVGNTPDPTTASASYLSTQVDIITSDRVAERAMELLPADQPPLQALREEASQKASPKQWTLQALQRNLEVTPSRESNVITISWTGSSPAEAARVANAFAQAYFDTNLSLRTGPSKRDDAWFDQQAAQLRERLQNAQARLAAYQEKTGILSATEQGDDERQRLAELSAQLVAAESRERVSPSAGLAQSPLVNNMRAEVARLEARAQEAAATMGPNHPTMRKMQAELESMRGRLASESATVSRQSAGSGQAQAQRIRELRRQIAEQKKRVLAMGKGRGELSVLQQEAESAQRAYDTVMAAAARSRLQSASPQGNVVLLGAAAEPLEPTGLRKKHALALAAFGGLLLAVAGALLAELLNRRVRCVEDLESVAGVPILGVVPAPRSGVAALRLPRAQRRLAYHLPRSIA